MTNIREFRVVWNTGTAAVGASTFHTMMETTPAVAANAWWGFMNAVKGELVTGATGRIAPEYRVISAETGQLQDVQSFDPSVSPTATGPVPLVAQATQVLVRWRTEAFVGGRRVQGRMFIPCLSAGKTTVGQLSPASQLTFSEAASTFRSSLGLLVWHRPTSGGSNGLAATVTSSGVWEELATQRRRRRA